MVKRRKSKRRGLEGVRVAVGCADNNDNGGKGKDSGDDDNNDSNYDENDCDDKDDDDDGKANHGCVCYDCWHDHGHRLVGGCFRI